MTATQPLPVIDRFEEPATKIGLRWSLLMILAATCLAYLPILIVHGQWLWNRPHYQFFPLVLLGSAVLGYSRLRAIDVWQPGQFGYVLAGFVIAWSMLVLAMLLSSTWLGCISFMLMVPTLIYAVGSYKAVRAALPAWVLLWFAIPPPLDLDRVLIFKLQNLTTGWSSGVLDTLGVFHVRLGNVIERDGESLLVEQACSGINSLFSILSCTLFLVLWTRRDWICSSILLFAAIGWVMVANVARVTGIVLLDQYCSLDLSQGWRHDVFGLFLFLLAVGLLLSTDQLLAFLVRPSSSDARTALIATRLPSVTSVYHALPGRNRVLMLASSVAFVLLAIGVWSQVILRSTQSQVAVLPKEDPELLPSSVGEWKREQYSILNRDSQHYFGEHSQTWVFRRNRLTAVQSLDYPFPDWHDLTWCYTARGWEIESQSITTLPDSCGFVEVSLTKAPCLYGYLVFCEFDGSGMPLAARAGGTQASIFRHHATINRLRSHLGFTDTPQPDPAGPVFQFQTFMESPHPIEAEDRASLRRLFLQSQQVIRNTWSTKN